MGNFKLRGKTKPSRSIYNQPGKKSTNIQGLKPRSDVKKSTLPKLYTCLLWTIKPKG